jgi:hypothetical protein
MSEQHDLDVPVTTPAISITGYKVRRIELDLEQAATVPLSSEPGLVSITLKDNNGVYTNYTYTGATAVTMIKTLNTANLTTKSLQKRILEQLEKDGKIGTGNVSGTPDP